MAPASAAIAIRIVLLGAPFISEDDIDLNHLERFPAPCVCQAYENLNRRYLARLDAFYRCYPAQLGYSGHRERVVRILTIWQELSKAHSGAHSKVLPLQRFHLWRAGWYMTDKEWQTGEIPATVVDEFREVNVSISEHISKCILKEREHVSSSGRRR